jgi:hypothetical protein
MHMGAWPSFWLDREFGDGRPDGERTYPRHCENDVLLDGGFSSVHGRTLFCYERETDVPRARG